MMSGKRIQSVTVQDTATKPRRQKGWLVRSTEETPGAMGAGDFLYVLKWRARLNPVRQ